MCPVCDGPISWAVRVSECGGNDGEVGDSVAVRRGARDLPQVDANASMIISLEGKQKYA